MAVWGINGPEIFTAFFTLLYRMLHIIPERLIALLERLYEGLYEISLSNRNQRLDTDITMCLLRLEAIITTLKRCFSPSTEALEPKPLDS